MEETDSDSAPLVRIVAAVALASLLSLLAYPVGAYVETALANDLAGLLNQGSSFAFIGGEALFVIEPWESVIVSFVVPFLLFFWLSGWAGINPYEDLSSVAIQAFGWGILLSLVGPLLDYPLLGSMNFHAFRTVMLSTISNPASDLGLVVGGILVSMIAVAGVSFGFFWRQTHYHSLRSWLERDEDPDDQPQDEEPPQEVQTPPDTAPLYQPRARGYGIALIRWDGPSVEAHRFGPEPRKNTLQGGGRTRRRRPFHHGTTHLPEWLPDRGHDLDTRRSRHTADRYSRPPEHRFFRARGAQEGETRQTLRDPEVAGRAQGASVGSQSVRRLSLSASSLVMSDAEISKSKTSEFSLIRSRRDDFGISTSPCWRPHLIMA